MEENCLTGEKLANMAVKCSKTSIFKYYVTYFEL